MRPARTVVVELRCPLLPEDARQTCERVEAMLRDPAVAVVCRLRGPVDLGVVDALARLHLAARRYGAWLRVAADGSELEDLLRLTGMQQAVPDRLRT